MKIIFPTDKRKPLFVSRFYIALSSSLRLLAFVLLALVSPDNISESRTEPFCLCTELSLSGTLPRISRTSGQAEVLCGGVFGDLRQSSTLNLICDHSVGLCLYDEGRIVLNAPPRDEATKLRAPEVRIPIHKLSDNPVCKPETYQPHQCIRRSSFLESIVCAFFGIDLYF